MKKDGNLGVWRSSSRLMAWLVRRVQHYLPAFEAQWTAVAPPTRTTEVLVVGSANVDLTAYTERLPAPGETVLGQSMEKSWGGKGANQAVMAARLGARVSLLCRVGQDAFGSEYTAQLQSEGVHVILPPPAVVLGHGRDAATATTSSSSGSGSGSGSGKDDEDEASAPAAAATGVALITVAAGKESSGTAVIGDNDDSGDSKCASAGVNMIVVAPGANALMNEADVSAAAPLAQVSPWAQVLYT